MGLPIYFSFIGVCMYSTFPNNCTDTRINLEVNILFYQDENSWKLKKPQLTHRVRYLTSIVETSSIYINDKIPNWLLICTTYL